ncbi:outer membrane beta-barrel protein [Bacteroidota bacterium]
MKTRYKLLKLISLTVLVTVFSVVCLNAQNDDLSKNEQELVEKLKNKPLNGFFGITFTNCVPQGEFYDNLKKSGQGFSVFGGYQMDQIPVAFGLEGDIMFFGGDERHFPVYDKDTGWRKYTDTVETQSMMVPINVFARLQPNIINLFYPYLEGIVGINLLSVSADYRSQYWDDDSKDKFDVAFNYGFGAGIMVKLVDFIQLPNSHSQMLFNVGMRLLKGTKADYATVKIKDSGEPDFNDFSTQTDLILFLAGITFRF